jgi:FkbM family methyltransferase
MNQLDIVAWHAKTVASRPASDQMSLASMITYAKDSRLIFDLGMNDGDDTAFYLRRGYNVVALDANPALCQAAEVRFRDAIADKRLIIRNAAIWDREQKATFYVNLDNDHWSSLDIGWAGRDASSTREITIDCLTLKRLFAEFGVPLYLKIDVEGVDHTVLDQLRTFDLLPLYVSVEDCRFGFQYMDTLSSCGYDGFKLLDQSIVPQMVDEATSHKFAAGSSGPFGEDLPGDWLSHADMKALYTRTVRDRNGNRIAPRSHWWDIHCTNLGNAKICKRA